MTALLGDENSPQYSIDEAHPAIGGKINPVGEVTSANGGKEIQKDQACSLDCMDTPLPPSDEIYFPEGGFRAWSVVFGVCLHHLDYTLSLPITFTRFLVVPIGILIVSFSLNAYYSHSHQYG
jgi:hypothetical protein